MSAWANVTREARRSTRVFCFPYAGGGASIYRRLERFFPEEYEVVPVQLPGREERLSETPYESMDALVDAATTELQPLVRGRCVFLGYSLGALVAYEVAQELSRRRRPIQRLIVAAANSPTAFSDVVPPPREESDNELIDRLRDLGATPLGLLSNHEMMKLVLPPVRADFRILDTYRYQQSSKLQCPVSAIAGDEDEDASPVEMAAWSAVTSGPFSSSTLAGGHFFIHSSPRTFVDSIVSAMKRRNQTRLAGRIGAGGAP